MNVLAHNLIALNSRRVYGENWVTQSKSMEKLSSGYRINRSADDASGLAISEKMRKQIRGLSQARDNVQDGISMVQIADGALVEVHDMLQRGHELMIKAANGTLSDSDRENINMEIQQLKSAIDGIAANTKFNETYLFPPDGDSPALANAVVQKSYTLDFNNKGVYKVTYDSGEIGVGNASSINTGNLLADKIATEYVPNAVNQILGRFDSLNKAINTGYSGDKADKLKMSLDISFIDGPSKKLAFVRASFTGAGQELSKLELKVDSADFSEDDIRNNSPKLGTLESTIGHEMMHAVMDAATSSRMCPGGAGDYPEWFIEGTAQLTGGGFATGWNEYLQDAVKKGASDDQLSSLLRQYTVDGRVYGHGYLAAAYIGQLASGAGLSNVSDASIVSGMNKVFAKLIEDPSKSFDDVISEVTGRSVQSIKDDINKGKADGVTFVRSLVEATQGNGAGSVIAPGGLAAIPTEVLGNSQASSKIYIDGPVRFGMSSSPGSEGTSIQAGADSDCNNRIALKLFRMTSRDLGISDIGSGDSFSERLNGDETVVDHGNLTMDEATYSIDLFAHAIDLVSGVRSYYGAVQNRMEHTIANLENVIENTTDAESRIRDTDMASEMVKMSLGQILLQAGQSMLSQANHSNDGILALI